MSGIENHCHMKIFTTEQIKEHDTYTITHEPIKSIDLMERAMSVLCKALTMHFPSARTFSIVCGMGNNGGDGLAIARMLHNQSYKVKVYLIEADGKRSEENQKNLSKLPSAIPLIRLKDAEKISEISTDAIVIDAIFGSGLTREPASIYASCIQAINRLSNPIIAIDVPSGISCENTPWLYYSDNIIRATHTFTLQHPKLSFFLPESAVFTGSWEVLDIGLHADFDTATETPYHLIDLEMAVSMLPARKRTDHKGKMGHALIVAGSYGKIGAAALAAKAALRSGAGLVSAFIPRCGYQSFQTAHAEIMVITADSEKEISGNVPNPMHYQSIGIGPGIGTGKGAAQVLKNLIQQYDSPLVLDADALNILSENPTWFSFLPSGSILTPHPGEFDRLTAKGNGYERWMRQIELSKKYSIYIVLKGNHTSISTPGGSLYFNYTGNPGMATGGSGDVLTGLISGLLAQTNSPLYASLLGVYLHGLAGDLALKHESVESLIASDIIAHLGAAFNNLKEQI